LQGISAVVRGSSSPVPGADGRHPWCHVGRHPSNPRVWFGACVSTLPATCMNSISISDFNVLCQSFFRVDKFSPRNPDWISHCAFGGPPGRAVTLPAWSRVFPRPDDSTSIARHRPRTGLNNSWLDSMWVAALQVESRATLTRIVEANTPTSRLGAERDSDP
jgi:hypothetical protein